MLSEQPLDITQYFSRLKCTLMRLGKPADHAGAGSSAAEGFSEIFSALQDRILGSDGSGSGGMRIEDYRRKPVQLTYYPIPPDPRKNVAGETTSGQQSVNEDLPAPANGERAVAGYKPVLNAVAGIAPIAPVPVGSAAFGPADFPREISEVASAGTPQPEVAADAPKAVTTRQRIDETIEKTARKYDLPVSLLKGVVQAESSYRVDAVSPAGAQGLMQLMPGTARELGVEDPFDIEQNIDGGARYLKKMLALFDGDTRSALAAYNAGPGTAMRYNGDVPYKETRQYVARVMRFAETVV